jgi:hypothetical protein
MKKAAFGRDGLPQSFIDRFGQHVTGFLSGFDRLRFRATLRPLFQPGGMEIYLYSCRVLVKDFATFAKSLTDRIRKAAYASFEQLGRPIRYLTDSSLSKEDLARQLVQSDSIQSGPIALFACVEPCLSFQVRGDRKAKELRVVLEHSKCTHLYHYYQHAQLGQLHVRVQTWFPFSVDVCLNGRQWLARQMDQAGVAYHQRDNCFVWIEDCRRAQALLDQQLRSNWAGLLDSLLQLSHPLQSEITSRMKGLHYYWSASQSEYATDILFDQPKNLERLYPQFIHHAVKTFHSPDVLRFLGNRHALQRGKVHGCFKGQVTTSLKERPEGVRLRHNLNGNSVKIYDKEGSVLRVETTIFHPEQFKVYRPKEGDAQGQKQWRKLRRGVADLYRRAEVSHAANQRYLVALASATGSSPLQDQAAGVCRAVFYRGRRYRGLNPLAENDYQLLRAVSRGEFTLSGLRNRHLRTLLCQPTKCPDQQRRQAATISRQLALLRAHALIKKLPHTHRYQLTTKGRKIITALLAACQADVEQLTKMAA